MQNTYVINAFFPPTLRNAEVMENLIIQLEIQRPKESFRYYIDSTAKAVSIVQRDIWLKKQIDTNNMITICNGNEQLFSSITFSQISMSNAINSILFSTLHLILNESVWAAVDWFILVSNIGIQLDAYELDIYPPRNTNFINRQVLHQDQSRKTPYDLPGMPDGSYGILPNKFPKQFSWISYWSKELKDNSQIDLERAKLMFYKTEELTNGALVIQMTEIPLNLEIPEHLSLLKNAYYAFLYVGGRHLLPEHLR